MDGETDKRVNETISREELVKLLCEHYDYVRKQAMAMIGDKHDAEDAAGEAMINAFEAIDDLRNPDSIKGWLRTIVKNEAKAYYAQKDKRKEIKMLSRLEAGEADISEFVAAEAEFREMMQRAEAAEFAREIMESLDPVYKSIMYMRFWGDYKFTEIGEVLNINVNTVRCMYARCRHKLCATYANAGKEGVRHEK